MDIPALETQLDRAKALLPDFSVLNDLMSGNSVEEIAQNMLEMDTRRGSSESLRLGLEILEGLYPRMRVTEYFTKELAAFYRISFGTGVRPDHRDNHLLRLLFPQARFPQDLDLTGAVFDAQRAARVEIALFQNFLNDSQSSRDIVDETLGISDKRSNQKDPNHIRAQGWLLHIRKLHGPDII